MSFPLNELQSPPLALVLLCVLAAVGCQPSSDGSTGDPSGDEPAPVEGSSAEASAEGSSGIESAGEGVDWQRVELRVQIPVVESIHRADRVAAIAPMDDGLLVLTHSRNRRNSRIDSWFITQDGVQEAVDTLTLQIPDEAAPRIVAIPGVGALIIKPTDNVADEEIAFNLVAWSVSPEGEIAEQQRVLHVPDGLSIREAWDATRLGDEALVCARAAGALVAPPTTPDVACGTVSIDAEWRLPLATLPLGVLPAHTLHLGRGGDRVVLFTFLESAPGVGRVFGSLLENGGQLALVGPVELTGEDYTFNGTPEMRRPPMSLANADGASYAIPRVGDHLPRAGYIAADGSADTPRLQVTELGTYVEHPIMIESAIGPSLVYESSGRNGERGAVLFGDGQDRPQLLDVVSPLGSRGAAASARFGAADNGYTSLVFQNDGEELPTVVFMPESAWGDADYQGRGAVE